MRMPGTSEEQSAKISRAHEIFALGKPPRCISKGTKIVAGSTLLRVFSGWRKYAVNLEQDMVTTLLSSNSPVAGSDLSPDKRRTNRLTGMVQTLARSETFKAYERAFGDATGLPLALRPQEVWNLSMAGKSRENRFCGLMAQCNRACAACLQMQEKIGDQTAAGPTTVTCFAGLSDTAVPVRVGDGIIGYLQTGQVSLKDPSAAQFEKIATQLKEWDAKLDLAEVKEAYFKSPILSSVQYDGMIKMLEMFAKHLSMVANEVTVQENEAESPLVRRARAYIVGHQADPIDLANVAKAMHVSTFYFCKMFKKATGLTFTEYLGRVRIEKAKTLLLNPHLRISEIAYDVGFQSLTHFNRVFRQVTGQSPTAYRSSKSADRSVRKNGLESSRRG
jgi:AraC-like DNA-binding protein/ligand-binding sensor protein